ncbi:MAG: ankyrin repeat domain-containing protein [Proteobacteria bacterium]|nr:ankyrin repeat domain-containing protein [Pseudomonadota bacterium]
MLFQKMTLHEAVRLNDHKALKRAIRRSIGSLDACDERGYTALHYAVIEGRVKCVKMLLYNGANPNTSNIPEYNKDLERHHRSSTPLWFAFEPGREQILKLLILSGANVNDLTGKQAAWPSDYCCEPYAPLREAISWGNVAAVRLLLKHEAKVDAALIRAVEKWLLMYNDDYLRRYPGARRVKPKDRQEILEMLKNTVTRQKKSGGKFSDSLRCSSGYGGNAGRPQPPAQIRTGSWERS